MKYLNFIQDLYFYVAAGCRLASAWRMAKITALKTKAYDLPAFLKEQA